MDAKCRHRRLAWAGKRRSGCSSVTVQKPLIITLVYITSAVCKVHCVVYCVPQTKRGLDRQDERSSPNLLDGDDIMDISYSVRT